MALKAKHPHIRIDQQIWDDPAMIKLSDRAFKMYVFAIAWSKCQNGRTEDGLLTDHGIGRIGATPEILAELQDSTLIQKCEGGYKILKYEEWQMTSTEERDEAVRMEEKREAGRQSAAKRWSRPAPAPEEGFDPEKAFEAAWAEWPEDGVFEKREDALEAFCAHITNSKDWAAFQAALLKRIKDYHSENKPKAERRRWLGAFKNFCDTRWLSYIPKSFRTEGAPVVLEASPPPKNEPLKGASEGPAASVDPLTESVMKFLAEDKKSA